MGEGGWGKPPPPISEFWITVKCLPSHWKGEGIFNSCNVESRAWRWLNKSKFHLQDCLQKQRLQRPPQLPANQKSIFGSGPKSRSWIRWGSRCPCQRDSETPLSLYHPEHLPKPYSHLSQRPKLISKQIRFLICIWMRAWSAVIHYRAWLCGLRHKSGSQRCHPVQGLLCANWFFAPSICPHLISSWNDTLHRPRKIEGKHRRYILHHE